MEKRRRATLVIESGSADKGLTRPTISSARRSSVSPIGAGLPTEVLGLKPQPLLQSKRKKGPLICTKLCDTMHQSTAGHVFELSNARDYHPFLEYNSLHDPHLKSYFYHPQMKAKLIKNGFVTHDLYVTCRSLKEYNAYRNFLESEFMKLYKAKEDAVTDRERREKSNKTDSQQRRQSNIEREEKRKQFFKQQEKKLRAKELHLRRREKQEYLSKMKALEERRMQRERNEIRREAEREQRKLRQLKREYEEASRRKSLLRQCEADERMRQIHLTHMRKEEKMKHLNELERRWQKYEEHAQRAKEEIELRRAQEKEERERRIQKREKLFQLLRTREEERQAKLHEENHQQVEQLKQQADSIEKKWKKEKESEVCKWKENIQKKRENWNHYVAHQKETTKKEQEKHMEELLKHTHLPSITTTTSRLHRLYGSSKSLSLETTQGQPAAGTVRFVASPTVHMIEDPLSEESSMHSDTAGANVSQIIDLEDDIEASLAEMSEMMSEELTMTDIETENVDYDVLDHQDSYHLQSKSRDMQNIISGDSLEDNTTEEDIEKTLPGVESDIVEHKSSMDLSHILEETGCVDTTSKTDNEVIVDEETAVLAKEDVSSLSSSATLHSVATLLDQQKSTASDLVERVMQNAVEIVSGSQFDLAMDTTV